MILFKIFLFLCLLSIPLPNVFAQTTSSSTVYRTNLPYVTSCPSNQYFDTASLQCQNCPEDAVQKLNDITQCDCINMTYYYGVNQGGGSLLCRPCDTNYVRSTDGFGCIQNVVSCNTLVSNIASSESEIDGTLYAGTASSSQPRRGNETCITCVNGTWPVPDVQRCSPCAKYTPRNETSTSQIACCTSSTAEDGICLTYVERAASSTSFNYMNSFNNPTVSVFFQQHLRAAFHLCRMNLNAATAQSSTRVLLSNATACHLLGNIIAMQFYYNGDASYAYSYYITDIWGSSTSSSAAFWTEATPRPSIPFLAYPSTYYTEIGSTTYNWIPTTLKINDLMRIKLAKYSANGTFLGLFDAFDTYLQLCGGGYTNGQAAFTFAAQYTQSCYIHADILWNSTLYETAFFDPYIQFTESGSDRLLPIPVVIYNYQSTSIPTYPNQNSDESRWVYHRRFFLIDRVSGVTTGNSLVNIHYAKSIQILTTVINGGTNIQPPVIYIEYGELSSSNIGTGNLIQVTFQSIYRMDLSTHIRDIWIAIGVLSGLGIFLTFLRTAVWQTRSGKEIIDLETIGKFFLIACNVLATVFFIVMAGVSLWWLIFYKRQDSVYLVLPTSSQQITFTVLIIISFALKLFDILHLIFRQSYTDLFFIDWEKPRGGDVNNVSVWRTYFVANEFHEIQTFRRINPTFQLFFVLFLLKVINLENIAYTQPNVNLFPSSADYKPGYNGILRVGIAFSMWLATALVQYIFYLLFYQRFIEDRLLNFIDLCSVSNISVFVLSDRHYGYYIHGRSPHGTTDVNMKDMLMNFEREAKQMSGSRGLLAKSEEQTFIIKIDQAFRMQYDNLLSNFRNRTILNVKQKSDEREAELSMTLYRNLNEFLSSFINHALPAYNYVIRDRYLVEKILNYEFQITNIGGAYGQTGSVFFIDAEKSFTNVMFCGHENSLLIWNMATFLFIDYFATNYVLAAIITYLLNFIANKLRLSLGRKNLSAKTLIPTNFLI